MRNLLLPLLALVLACESTVPGIYKLSGDYEGSLAGTGPYGQEATGTLKVSLDQHEESFDGFGQVSALVVSGQGEERTWRADFGLTGAVEPDSEPELTMSVFDLCSVSRLTGRRAGLAIVLFGEVSPADEDCVPLPGPIHMLARLEPVG